MTYKLRISRPILSHLSGSSAWQEPKRCIETGYETQGVIDMMEAIKAKTPRKDGSVTVALTDYQCARLREYIEVMAIGAKDNIEPPQYSYGNNWALAEYNAANALIRQIDKVK